MIEKEKCPSELEIEALLDGRLDEEPRLALSAHLQQCPACRGEFESLSRARQDLRLAAGLEPAPIDFARVAESIFGGSGIRARRLILALAGAAAFAVLAAWWFAWRPADTRAPVVPPVEMLAGSRAVRPAPGELLFLGALGRAALRAEPTAMVVDLESGKVLVRLEGKRSREFIVRTPAGDVAALGTVFSVEVKDGLSARVEMWRGSVELRPAGAAEMLRLEAPHCARLQATDARPNECSGRLSELIAEAENHDAGFGGLLEAPRLLVGNGAGHLEVKAQPAAPSPKKMLEEEISSVRRLLARRDFTRADKKLDELLRRETGDARVYLLQCDSARLQERLPQALDACRQATRLAQEKPQQELSLYQQGRILLALGRPAEAEEVFGRILREFPQGLLRQESQYAILECLLAQEKYHLAAESARAYLDAYPLGTGAEEVRKVLQTLEEKGWK